MLFTQNIDCLERRAGVPEDKIIEAHGSFASQQCIECHKTYPDDKMEEHVFSGQVPRCEDRDCRGLVKPDIVFFGESLPKAFGEKSHQTVMADLVLIIGTSLTVFPFASLPDMAREGAPRVLFNMERVGQIGSRADDVMELGPSDDGIRKLAELLGWTDELEKLWRGTVGDKEADRQHMSQKKHDEEVEDEVEKLAEGIDAVLGFDTAEDEDENKASDEPLVKDKDGAYVPKLGTAAETTVKAELAAVEPGKVSYTASVMDDRLGSILAAKQTEAAGDDKPDTQDDAKKSEIPIAELPGGVKEPDEVPVAGKPAAEL